MTTRRPHEHLHVHPGAVVPRQGRGDSCRAPRMDRVKTTKGAGYTLTAALMLALPQLILALPATAAPCDPKGVSVPARDCPTPPNRPVPAPVPVASATAVPASPSIPSVTVPAPRISEAPAPAATPEGTPADGPGALPPAEVAPASPSGAAPMPTPTADPAATATQASGRDGRGLPGGILLAFGGLLVAVWAFLSIRKPV